MGADFEYNYRKALLECANRYALMNRDASHRGQILDTFIKEFRLNIVSGAPLMKLNRWLGFIQCTMIEREFTTVQAERDWTRPLFRPLDFPVDNIAQ